MALNVKFAPRNRKGNYLLAGLVYCTCGRKRVGEKSAEHLYYRCSDRIYNFPLPRVCKEKGISAKILDNLVYNQTIKLLNNKALIKKQAQRWIGSKKSSYNEPESQIKALNERADNLKKEEERYLRVYGAGLSSFEAYEKQINDLKLRKTRLQNEQIKVESDVEQKNDKPALDVDTICGKVIQTIKKFNLEDKQAFVRKVINQIIANQTEALVKGYLPLAVEGNGEQSVSFKFTDSYLKDSTSHNIKNGEQNVSFKLTDRHSRFAQCRQEHIV